MQSIIEKAIVKWSMIAYGLTKSHGRHDCPLCIEFYEKDCDGCPIGVTNYKCEGTPCRETRSYTYLYDYPEMAEAVERQVIFICSLLPEDHKWYEHEIDEAEESRLNKH